MRGRGAPSLAELPASLPIFPLTGVLLLPRGRLPLNIFEPRYLAMTEDALQGDRLIGMVQPQEGAGDAGEPPVYRTGCAGRMTSFSETEDGRYLITLTGLRALRHRARAAARPALPPDRARLAGLCRRSRGRRRRRVDRDRLLAALKPFFRRHNIAVEWDAIDEDVGRAAGHHHRHGGALRAQREAGAARGAGPAGARAATDHAGRDGGA